MKRRTNYRYDKKSLDNPSQDHQLKKNRNKLDEKNNKIYKNKQHESSFVRDSLKRKNKKDSYNNSKKEHIQFKENNLDEFVWGKHSVLSVLESNTPINRVWCTSEIRSSEKFFLLLKELKSKGVLVEEVSWSRISQITVGGVHQGIVLQKSYSQTTPLNELVNHAKTNSSHPTLICLDGITDPHNLGAIVRSAEALGCKGLIIPQRRSAGITGTVAKVAAGALENIKISRVVNLNRALNELKKEGFLIIGLSAGASINITDFKQKVPLVIVIGSENKGLSVLTQRNCDYLLKIPLTGKTPSLNASVAAAISIFQLSKNLSSFT
ncbi:MAG: 23S rRNA (guanosine(2251)-2'-O)-methyltransferase RlmB [Prochlorococcus sp. SP3034]|nr:23S rRNA (guanosine(2251)-2'-O)-methyltransferase RlmB [Prochlorococcus sp. SP3034]|tara:strand:- start:6807 stop:7775 length:969 start_codon:yes stop_codon:yes gene_type:complete